MKKNVKFTLLMQKKLARIAVKAAEMEANSACPLIAYQPELPEGVN